MTVPKYSDSELWKRAFAAPQGCSDDMRAKYEDLRSAYRSLFSKAAKASDRIEVENPNLTNHGEDHLNGLWHAADKLLGLKTGVPCDWIPNAYEALLFGCAVCVHDLGQCPSVYPEGVFFDEEEWAALLKREQSKLEHKHESNELDEAKRRAVLFRSLQCHAKHAESLLTSAIGGGDEYFLSDPDLRAHFGRLAGRIARSHHDSVESVAREFRTLDTIMGPLGELDINSYMVAVLLRACDAVAIDWTRAPSLSFVLNSPERESRLHWQFQGKLSGSTVSHDYILYTTNSEFGPDERESWWLCYDYLNMVHSELDAIHRTSLHLGQPTLCAIGVKHVESPSAFQSVAPVIDWVPIDTEVRASNAIGLVKSLGGKQLYGDDPSRFLKEILANASDATELARATSLTQASRATVYFELQNVESIEVTVTDNGVGMNLFDIQNFLLNFGNSAWGSGRYQKYKDLGKIDPIGRFGIGFFSTLMVGSRVEVRTCYHEDRNTTWIVSFDGELEQRPWVRKAKNEERLDSHGTSVKVTLTHRSSKALLESVWNRQQDLARYWRGKEKQGVTRSPGIDALMLSLIPAPRFDLVVGDSLSDDNRLIAEADDWERISGEELLTRIRGLSGATLESMYHERALTEVRDEEGTLVGRVGLDAVKHANPARVSECGRLVTKGIVVDNGPFQFDGLLEGTPLLASRDTAVPVLTEMELTAQLDEERGLEAVALHRWKADSNGIPFTKHQESGVLPPRTAALFSRKYALATNSKCTCALPVFMTRTGVLRYDSLVEYSRTLQALTAITVFYDRDVPEIALDSVPEGVVVAYGAWPFWRHYSAKPIYGNDPQRIGLVKDDLEEYALGTIDYREFIAFQSVKACAEAWEIDIGELIARAKELWKPKHFMHTRMPFSIPGNAPSLPRWRYYEGPEIPGVPSEFNMHTNDQVGVRIQGFTVVRPGSNLEASLEV